MMLRIITPLATFATLMALLGAAPAHAVSSLIFGVVFPTTGSISFAGGGIGVNPLVGAGIDVDNVVGLPGDSPLACVGCVLNFTTGNLTGAGPTTYDFDGGGTITLVGAVPGAGIVDPVTLMSGIFLSAKISTFGSTFKIVAANFTDTKESDLLSYFELASNVQYSGTFNISFQASAPPPPGAFSSVSVLTGDIVNSPTIPEPSTAPLVLTGLLGLAARRRWCA